VRTTALLASLSQRLFGRLAQAWNRLNTTSAIRRESGWKSSWHPLVSRTQRRSNAALLRAYRRLSTYSTPLRLDGN
jgi:hypothetical protein